MPGPHLPRGRSPDGRAPPTAPHTAHAQPSQATAVGPSDQQRDQHPPGPSTSSPVPPRHSTIAAAAPAVFAPPVARSRLRTGRPTPQQLALDAGPTQDQRRLQAAFRGRAPTSPRSRRPGAARLWNPTNSTPRVPRPTRPRRPSTPPLPSVPLSHPTFDAGTADPVGTGAGDYPLLTLAEQRQTKHPAPSRPSLQVEHYGTSERRISLPRSVRHSYDEKRLSATPSPRELEFDWAFRQSIHEHDPYHNPYLGPLDKGKGRETAMSPDHEEPAGPGVRFSADLERGPEYESHARPSNVSAGDAIGSPVTDSSSNSSIMGEDVQGDVTHEWGPQHPCFPHLNPHVSPSSPEYAATRIIRVRRDFMVAGDAAPTFSDTYPDILDPAGLSEQEFRRVVGRLNGELVAIHDPLGWRNIFDGVLGLVTGWLWDDLGLTAAKARLRKLEEWVERWNEEMEKALGQEDGMAPKIIPLRKTGYMTVCSSPPLSTSLFRVIYGVYGDVVLTVCLA